MSVSHVWHCLLQASIMTGSGITLGVSGGRPAPDPLSQAGHSPLRRPPMLHPDPKSKASLRMSERTWESRRIKEEMQEILSPTPLELHKVHNHRHTC